VAAFTVSPAKRCVASHHGHPPDRSNLAPISAQKFHCISAQIPAIKASLNTPAPLTCLNFILRIGPHANEIA